MHKCMYTMALMALSLSAFAADSVTIPDTGLDIGKWITAAIVLMASVAGVAIGGFFAFLIVKKALLWGAKALG